MLEQRGQLLQSFSQRLTDILIEKGYASSRANGKVSVRELARISNCSYQMARKYAIGAAFPDYETIQKISSWLNVSAGWLLFGEGESENRAHQGLVITLEKDVIQYIIKKFIPICINCSDIDEMVKFATDIFYDTSHISADKEIIFKFIDMAIGSAERFLNIGKQLNKQSTRNKNGN